MSDRPTKITFAEMRESGAHGLLVYCADYRGSHSIAVSAIAHLEVSHRSYRAWPSPSRRIWSTRLRSALDGGADVIC